MPKENETSTAAVLDHMLNRPLDERIRERAYELFLQRGCEDGHAMEDWVNAEVELLSGR